jgi:hypothetical protein
MRGLRRSAVWLVVVAVAACGGGSNSSGSKPPSGSSAAPKGPASAQLTFVGDAGLAGSVTFTTITCSLPQADGSVIVFLLGNTPGSSQVAFNIHISPAKIDVLVASGSGQSFTSREFVGNGVAGFDPAKGAQIDTALAETTAANANRGTLGVVTSVKGLVDCGNQTNGVANLVYSGSTAEGPLSGEPNPFHVQCASNPTTGQSASVTGLVKVGSAAALFQTTVSSTGVFIVETGTGPPPFQHVYRAQTTNGITVSATGAHVTADVIEQSVTAGSPHTIHIEGDLTCG